MGSLGVETARHIKTAMWVYPKMMGANPSERWGHTACSFNGLVYIFGGCRGGVHFSDVLVCNLSTMTWKILETSGEGPGPRDSHSAVVVGQRMVVFGGTNGSRKVNDLHVLDLLSGEWARPECRGDPPCPRESHTTSVIDGETLVVFGGSGEGDQGKSSYLNDLHILDMKSMEWSKPIDVRGSVPAPRDSHSSVVVGNRLFVFGGDSGDRYQGDTFVFDINKFVWSRVDVQGPSPRARAGHAAVSVGTKVYILGGVGDKQYYNDIWVLNVITSSWVQLDICSQISQGRFSHTATVTNLGIAIFGGCGEDERPLNELLILQIDSLTYRAFGNTFKEETNMFLKNSENNMKPILVGDNEDLTSQEVEELEFVTKQSFCFSSDMLHPKRRRTSNNSKLPEKTSSKSEEHYSLSQSQQSSPSQSSDHQQTPAVKKSIANSYSSSSTVHPLFTQKSPCPSFYHLNNNNNPPKQTNSKQATSKTAPDIYLLSSDHPNPVNRNISTNAAAESLSMESGKFRNLIGAEVRGQVDGAFDSGYLMTATVNGKVYRGVLFAPGPDLVSRGGQHLSPFAHQIAVNRASPVQNLINGVAYNNPRHSQQSPAILFAPEQAQSRRLSPENRAPRSLGNKDSIRVNSELQGVVLTLASPATDYVRQ